MKATKLTAPTGRPVTAYGPTAKHASPPDKARPAATPLGSIYAVPRHTEEPQR